MGTQKSDMTERLWLSGKFIPVSFFRVAQLWLTMMSKDTFYVHCFSTTDLTLFWHHLFLYIIVHLYVLALRWETLKFVKNCYFSRKHPLPTTQEKTLHIDNTRWSIPKSDWLYSLQPKMEKLCIVNKNKTGSSLWLRSLGPYCRILT